MLREPCRQPSGSPGRDRLLADLADTTDDEVVYPARIELIALEQSDDRLRQNINRMQCRQRTTLLPARHGRSHNIDQYWIVLHTILPPLAIERYPKAPA